MLSVSLFSGAVASWRLRCCQITHHFDDVIGIVHPIVQVLCLDFALCLCQFQTPRLLYGVGDIGRDDKALHVGMESDDVCGSLRNGG